MVLIKLCWVVFFLTTISFIEAAQHCRCENGGECVYDNYRFKYCKCPKGYTGLFCSELIECSNSSPCQNGARCVSSHGKSQCVCVNGYTGPDCSINIDDCASNPCSAGSICHDRVGSFFCECSKGWTGLLCQLRDGCASNPCHPSATCYANPTNGSAMCSCPKGYKGEDCSIDINECEESGSPCEHGGTCVNTEGSFRCDCLPGFTGSRCEININECASNPCINEGTCLDEIGGFRCICAPGYTGTQCETDIDECIDKPCLNNGVCTNLINGYRCLCPNGFNGTKCEINENECANSPCLNGGQCVDGIAQYTCNCLPGYTGLNCEININECLSNPCANGGQCIDGINSYVCTCQPGFTGPNCQTDINECLSNPCYHGGICHDLANGFKCECPLGTSGIRCEYNTNECWSNPCRNGALCHDKINGYDCECAPGFTGLNCEIDIDECASSPCANGGKCHDLPNGFKCTCPKGYYDARCMSDVNECDPNPCLNGAQCEDDVNKYICHCLPGYTGPRCELEVDACASSPCQHNGQCMNYMGNYKCVCPAGFTGKSCEINISDCNASLFGDCLLGYNVNPWVNCTHSTFCWKAFSDGVCNEVCNTKECLFDGMDCLNKQKNAGSNNRYIIDKDDKQNQDIRLNGKRRQCHPEFDSYCQRNYQNGYCDQGCNNEQCGWDGLDCLEVNQKNNVKQYNYAQLPYVARGSLLITLDVPFNKLTETNEIQGSQKAKADERPIHYILRVLSQIVGTTLRVKQDYNDGNLVLRPVKNDNGENLTEVEVIADNRMCEYDCFDSAMQIANYLAAFQARTNELSHQFGHNTKFSLKSIRAREEAESLVGQNYPKEKEATSIVSWISCCIVIIFIGVLLGVLITNNKKRVAHGITWFPEGFTLKSGASCRSISTYNAAGGEYSRNKPLSKLRGNLHKLDRKPDGQEMSKNWMGSENLKTIPENKDLNTISHVIYEEPKDPRPWSMQHYEAYGDGKNQGSNNNGNGIVMPLQMYPDLKQILHPGLMQPQNMVMQTKANTEPPTNGLLSPPLVGCPGGVDVTGPSGLTPLMVAAAFRGATPFCGVGGDEASTATPVTETTQLLDNELMDTHNGPGSAGSSNGTSGNSSSSMIDALISQGASVDKKMENTGETSLHLAARFCRADAVKRLLEAKADCNAQDFSGRTPLHTAIAADACGAFEILIRNRATQLNAKSNDGNTPLIIAVRNCADSMMNELLLAGADVNASDNAERSALHWAAMVSNMKALKALIEYGANKDAQDEKEQTPLFLAAREGAYECVKTLLQAGANKDITDHMDVSPRKIAETKGHKDILGLLDGNVPITINSNSNNQNSNTQNSSANNPTSPHVVSPKKNSNNNTGTNKRRKQTKAQQAQVQAENAQQQNKSNNQQNLQNINQNYNQPGQTTNQNNTNTIKKAKATSALNQQPPPLPPPRPQPAPVQIPLNIQNKTQVVNIPQNQQGQMIQQNHIQNIPSPFDYMIHTPLTPTCNQQQINIPATINNMTNLNCPPMNHVLLSPNNTVLMSPPHHASGPMHQPHHYLGNPPPYEDSISHSNQQQISNATYMVNNQINSNQWQYKPEPNYYTIFNNNQNMDASYLTPSPDSPSNWSATTSPASAGDWLELQTPQQQSQQQNQMTNQQIIQDQQVQLNQLNQQIQPNQQDLQTNKQQQMINNQITHQKIQHQLIDQQQSSIQVHQEQQIHVQQQLNQQPPAYQASCNQNSTSLQPSSNNNNRQPTTTQQSVFL